MYLDFLLKDLISTSTVVREYVHTKKTPGNGNPFLFPRHSKTEFCSHFRDTPKRNSLSVSETLQNRILFPFPRHSKTEFRFCFQDTSKQNPVSVSGLHYSINPNSENPNPCVVAGALEPDAANAQTYRVVMNGKVGFTLLHHLQQVRCN